jgi:hypothetical protein
MKIQHVPLEFVNQTWPFVQGFLAKAIENQGGEKEVTIDHIKVYVTSGQWMLLVATDEQNQIKGAATINFFNRPDNRVAFVTHIGGRLVANQDTFDQLRALCRSFGATKIEGAVTSSIARLWRRFGFTEKYTISEVSI